jgi:hypothetical protein
MYVVAIFLLRVERNSLHICPVSELKTGQVRSGRRIRSGRVRTSRRVRRDGLARVGFGGATAIRARPVKSDESASQVGSGGSVFFQFFFQNLKVTQKISNKFSISKNKKKIIKIIKNI